MKSNLFFDILSYTAWQMEAPVLFGAFHVTAALLAVTFAAVAAVFFARRIAASPDRKQAKAMLYSAAERLRKDFVPRRDSQDVMALSHSNAAACSRPSIHAFSRLSM